MKSWLLNWGFIIVFAFAGQNDTTLSFDTSEGIIWKIGSQSKIEKKISFWLGKRAQTGKKVPKLFT